MPEGIEAEYARELIERRALGRTVARVHAPDAWYLKRGLTPSAARRAWRGSTTSAARRRGKLILVDTAFTDAAPQTRGRAAAPPAVPGPTLGLHLGMSGRILVDGEDAGDPLVFASNRHVPEWIRFRLEFDDGGSLAVRDPRRLGAVELDPDEDRLGPDAFSITLAQLRAAIGASRAPVKAALMDQRRVAGVGNLLADEVLWRAGIDPARPAVGLGDDELRTLHRTLRRALAQLWRRGGSHTGDLMPERHPGGYCPRDGAPLLRRTVGGRTTFSCPRHQV